MTLRLMVRLLGTLLVVVACLPIFQSGELPWPVWGIVAGGLLAGWFTSTRTWPRAYVVALTTLLTAGLAGMLLLSLLDGEWLVNSITFGLLATVARTLQQQTSRQQFQLIALSFLLMVAAAVTNPDPAFALYFVAYSILLTWALTYTHLLQRVEEAAGGSGMEWKASRFVSGRFLLGSSLLALVLLASSSFIFLLFPRLGLGFFSAQTRRADPITGFSNTIELGHFGNLRDSTRVVMRVEFGEGREYLPPVSMMHFRGISFESYDGSAWSRRQTRTRPLRPGLDSYFEIDADPRLRSADYHTAEVDIYLEPLESENKVLFLPVRPIAVRHLATRFDRFRGTTRNFEEDEAEDLALSGPSGTSFSYTAQAGILRASVGDLRNLPMDYPRTIRRRYLQLPETLDPRIVKLAESVTADAANPYDMAVRLVDHLQLEYGFTTVGAGDTADPIAAFLFERRKGHCEYFATAMVLMLRTLGVPSRPVNGFLGASYNEFGDFYSVTEGRAHTWVEAWFPRYGWLTFDPTPAAETPPEDSGFFAALDLWVDALRLRWYKWVVEYDLEKQLAVYTAAYNLFASQQNQVHLAPDLSVSQMRAELKKIGRSFKSPTFLAVAGLLLLAALGVPFTRRLLARRSGRVQPFDKLAARLRKAMRRKGYPATPGTTLPALARAALASGFSATPELARLVVLLEQARWSNAPPPPMRELELLLRRVKTGRSNLLTRSPRLTYHQATENGAPADRSAGMDNGRHQQDPGASHQ